MDFLYAIVGIIIGAAPVYYILNSRLSIAKAALVQAEPLNTKIQPLEVERMQLYGKTQADKATIDSLRDQNKALEADKVNMEGKLKKILTDITNDSFIKQGKHIADAQQAKLLDILNPLRDKINDFQAEHKLFS